MSFDYCIAYEDRACVHTSRWSLDGVKTLSSGGNTSGGWLWMTCVKAGGTVTVELFKDDACQSADKVAQGTADVSQIDTSAALCQLTEANSSSLSGEFYFESYLADIQAAAMLVTLCTDDDLSGEYHNLSDLPDGVYDQTFGMARYCALATQKVLLLVSQMYAGALGGCGAPEHRYHSLASRQVPDYRRIASPDQLKDTAVHWALMLAFGSCHQRGTSTMYSQLRDYHDAKRKEAVAAWNLAFNSDPDTDEDADAAMSSSMTHIRRL